MLSVDLGYRYDDIKYQPEYIPGVTPKIADDMVKERMRRKILLILHKKNALRNILILLVQLSIL